MTKLTAQADKIAARVIRLDLPRGIDDLRDICDKATGGELDCQPLDILVGMVASRIKRATGGPGFLDPDLEALYRDPAKPVRAIPIRRR